MTGVQHPAHRKQTALRTEKSVARWSAESVPTLGRRLFRGTKKTMNFAFDPSTCKTEDCPRRTYVGGRLCSVSIMLC